MTRWFAIAGVLVLLLSLTSPVALRAADVTPPYCDQPAAKARTISDTGTSTGKACVMREVHRSARLVLTPDFPDEYGHTMWWVGVLFAVWEDFYGEPPHVRLVLTPDVKRAWFECNPTLDALDADALAYLYGVRAMHVPATVIEWRGTCGDDWQPDWMRTTSGLVWLDTTTTPADLGLNVDTPVVIVAEGAVDR